MYNEQLVQRGEILLDVGLTGWQEELERMNEGKEGSAFVYSDSLIVFFGTLKVAFRLGYREGEGLAGSIAKLTESQFPMTRQSTEDWQDSHLN